MALPVEIPEPVLADNLGGAVGRAKGSVTACKSGFTLTRVDFVAPDTSIRGLELVLAPRAGANHPLCP